MTNSIRKFGYTSPYGMMMIALIGFLFAWVFPPGVYSFYTQEPDRMFLDVLTAVFFVLCLAAFAFGLKTSQVINPGRWRRPFTHASVDSPFLYLCIPIICTSLFCGGALMVYGAKVNFIALLASQQGQTIKDYGKAGGLQEGLWTYAPHFLVSAIWWSLYRIRQMRLAPSARLTLLIICGMAFLLVEFTAMAMVNRNVLLAALAGVGIIYLHGRESIRRLRLARLVFYGFSGIAVLLVLFTIVSIMRGNSSSDLLVGTLLGYSISAYNRLASILHGQLTLLYGGTGVYLFTYLQTADSLNNIFHYKEILHWPDFQFIFSSEFSSMVMAGLSGRYNWVSVPGYLFADIGWGALIYLYGVGIFAGSMWGRFRSGTAIGVTVYPWVAIWVLFWNGANTIFNGDFAHILFGGIALTVWDKLFLSTHPIEEQVTESVASQVPAVQRF